MRIRHLFILTWALVSAPLLALAGPRLDDRASVQSCAQHYASLRTPLTIQFVADGPRVSLPALKNGTRDFDSIDELRVGTFNVLNLEEMKGKFEYNPATGKREMVLPPKAKDPKQLEGVADTIRRADSDVLFLQEVESMKSLRTLTDKLGDRYRPILIEGNDERGIDVAILVKKDLPLDLEVQSYRNRKQGDKLIFSRDLPALSLRRPGEPKPVATFLGTHYKSQRDSGFGANVDPGSIGKRTEQAKETTKIYGEIRRADRDAPVFLLGDFNSAVPTGPEFQPLWDAGFRDAFDQAGVAAKDRVSHSYFPRDAAPHFQQMDAVVIAEGQAKNLVKKAEIVPYVDANGQPLPLPTSYADRETQPSDHRMVSVVIDFKKIREARK